ncbi:hypothetical protein [Novosphingobium rhizosphaerae]|uniref:hypothetical protein n=1 Tax=Novosphingobium rhizosphaerae TaxID=1551649 RepID=UPI003D816543
MTQMILDVSRLISRMHYSTPSGVDRVEMAYARGLLARLGEGLAFAAVHPTGLYGRLRRSAILPYLDELERRWSSEENGPERRSVVSNLPQLFELLPQRPGAGGKSRSISRFRRTILPRWPRSGASWTGKTRSSPAWCMILFPSNFPNMPGPMARHCIAAGSRR